MKLVKTANISPSTNYIFGIHPHGVMCMSGFGNFCTEGTNFSKLFPGLSAHVLMLKWLFYLPLTREILLFKGASAVTKNSFRSILGNEERQTKKKGQVCVVVVGGAEESLEAHPNTYRLILKNRKGFIRMALITGASLVPVFTFGENDLFHQLSNSKNSRMRRFQSWFKQVTAVGLPICWGQGFTENSLGPLALQRPVTSVVGSPIKVVKNSNPSEEEVNRLHGVYLTELKKLFEENKKEYCDNKNIKLEII